MSISKNALSADKIHDAILCKKSSVKLTKDKTVYNFSDRLDRQHCIDILINQINLIHFKMADTTRIYTVKELEKSVEFLTGTSIVFLHVGK